MDRLHALVVACVASLASCAAVGEDSAAWSRAELGEFHRPVTTKIAEAQRWFDQGLVLCFGFDQEVARLSFERAAQADPMCAMAFWGKAYASGPHINNPAMDEEGSRIAHEAAQWALDLSIYATDVERALIIALNQRYAWPPPADRAELDRAYADAMREVWHAHPNDADIGALFAEALMDLRPWDLWSADGEPRPETPEVIATLEAVLALDPEHPGAQHYYIHTMEASKHPEKALVAANALRARVPGASHLVHMPSHIDIRVGNYAEAIAANARATVVDTRRIERHGAGGFYALYRAHNYHFLMWAAMFDGQRAVALKAARDVVEQMPIEVVRSMPQFIEGFMGSPYHVMVRFGLWEELLREPEPAADLYGTLATWRYARTLALTSLGRTDEATAEREKFETACGTVPESYTMGNNPVRAILDVAREMVAGELEFRRGNTDLAFEHLREAVKRDDALRYDEPWGWVQPARHALGALLLEAGRLDEAEAVYRRDLERHPNNGWSLHGLAECLRRTQRELEATSVESDLRRAWLRSDVELKASCFCRRGV
jgi:tetratricopeptide (TPR) repeat protein